MSPLDQPVALGLIALGVIVTVISVVWHLATEAWWCNATRICQAQWDAGAHNPACVSCRRRIHRGAR